MKKIFAIALLLATASAAHAQYTTTTNVGMKKPNAGLTSGWDVYVDANYDTLDALLGGVNTLTLNSATPTVTSGTTWLATNSSTTTITNFTGFPGQRLILLCNDALTSVATDATIAVDGTFSCTAAGSGSLTLVLNGTVWTEIGRATISRNRRVCDIAVGDASASALTNSQLGPQKRICYIPGSATILELDVSADAGTPNIIVGRNHAGTVTNIVSTALATAAAGAIACSNAGGTTGLDGATTCGSTLQNTALVTGDYLELVSGTAGGTAKLMTAHVIYTVNN